MPHTTPPTLIIGAGIAGLTCAQALVAAGQPVVVIDKGRLPGGRMATRFSRASSDYQFDHGAQYFTARTPPFIGHVEGWMTKGVIKGWAPNILVYEGGTWRRSSPKTRRYVGVPSMASYPQALATGLDLRMGQRAIALKGAPGNYTCTLESGEALPGLGHVIVNAPPPQASSLLAPVAPTLATDIAKVPMLPCWAIMVELPSPLPSPVPGQAFDGAFINHGPLSWIARDSAKPGRPKGERWVCHGSPQWSTANLEESRDYVATALTQALRDCLKLGDFTPTSVIAHRWRYARSGDGPPPGVLWDGTLGLGACGDWCEGGRVEGAFLSGQKLAQRVLDTPLS